MKDNSLINSIPDSESDKLLKQWGYDLKADCFKIISFANISKPAAVLDLATGTGRICSVLTRFGYNVITGDYKQADIEKAKSRITHSFLHQVSFISVNMEVLPFKDNTVENIVCLNTIHELDNPRKCIKEMMRVHSGKGKLVISDFSKKGFELMQRIHEIIYGNDHRTGFITMEEIKELLCSEFISVRSLCSELNVSHVASGKKINPRP